MILGDGPLAQALRYHHPDTPFIWVAYDTPIRADGRPDTNYILRNLAIELPAREPADIVISSQLPVGTAANLAIVYPQHTFAVLPENVRASHAVDDWANQPRIIIGTYSDDLYYTVADLLYTCSSLFLHTDPTTAEFTKHALNAYLALTVTYATQIANLGESLGVNVDTVATSMKADPRVGWNAYLNPEGTPGRHLLRDVNVLRDLGLPILENL